MPKLDSQMRRGLGSAWIKRAIERHQRDSDKDEIEYSMLFRVSDGHWVLKLSSHIVSIASDKTVISAHVKIQY